MLAFEPKASHFFGFEPPSAMKNGRNVDALASRNISVSAVNDLSGMGRRTSVAAATTLGGGNDQSRATYSRDRVRSLGAGRTAGGPLGAALAGRRGAVRGGDRGAPGRAKRAAGRTDRRDAAPPNEAQGRRGRRRT